MWKPYTSTLSLSDHETEASPSELGFVGCARKHVGNDDLEPIQIEPNGGHDPDRVLRIDHPKSPKKKIPKSEPTSGRQARTTAAADRPKSPRR